MADPAGQGETAEQTERARLKALLSRGLHADEIDRNLKASRSKGGKARARKLSAARRSEIARKAALTRWANHTPKRKPTYKELLVRVQEAEAERNSLAEVCAEYGIEMAEYVDRVRELTDEREHLLGVLVMANKTAERRGRRVQQAERALRLALNGIPDPMHPGIPMTMVDGLVCAQIVLMDALGFEDPGDVEAARAVLGGDGQQEGGKNEQA